MAVSLLTRPDAVHDMRPVRAERGEGGRDLMPFEGDEGWLLAARSHTRARSRHMTPRLNPRILFQARNQPVQTSRPFCCTGDDAVTRDEDPRLPTRLAPRVRPPLVDRVHRVELGAADAEPFTFLSIRFLLAIVALAPAALLRGSLMGPWALRGHALVVGALVHRGYLGGVFWAIRHGMPAGSSR